MSLQCELPPYDELRMQNDGDLVYYIKHSPDSDGYVAWSSNTKGSGSHVVLENDGNLVVYDKRKERIWQSNYDYKNKIL